MHVADEGLYSGCGADRAIPHNFHRRIGVCVTSCLNHRLGLCQQTQKEEAGAEGQWAPAGQAGAKLGTARAQPHATPWD